MLRSFSTFLWLFFGVLTVFAPASAQVTAPMTALQLQGLCASKYDVDFGICAGYVTAVAERLMGENDPYRRVCLSPAIAPQTLVGHVEKVWEAQPPQPQDFAIENVELALRQRFQCPR